LWGDSSIRSDAAVLPIRALAGNVYSSIISSVTLDSGSGHVRKKKKKREGGGKAGGENLFFLSKQRCPWSCLPHPPPWPFPPLPGFGSPPRALVWSTIPPLPPPVSRRFVDDRRNALSFHATSETGDTHTASAISYGRLCRTHPLSLRIRVWSPGGHRHGRWHYPSTNSDIHVTVAGQTLVQTSTP